AEGRSEAVDLAEGETGGLEVELPRLAQIGLLIEIVGLEQRRRALARRRSQDRGIDEDEIALVEEVPDRLADLAADAQESVLLRRTEPEVAMIQEEIGPVLLRGDRVVVRLLVHGDRGQLHLIAAGSAVVPADRPFDF